MNPLAAASLWALDYVYAGWWQVVGAVVKHPPARYRRGDASKPQVVVLPGVYETWVFMKPIADDLNRGGHRIAVVNGLGYNRRGIADTSERLARALGRMPATPAGCIIVAHSKGGLIGKHLLLHAGGDLGIRGLVTVCTPFAGARRARYLLDPSVRALLPNDETIVTLGSDTSVNGRIVSIFGTFDPHVPDGSELAGATNIRVPVAGHFRILGSRATRAAVREATSRLSPPKPVG